ncbi:MAG TPA: hypothetical protein VMV92_17970 [Streptosporangiaceae bacterium]|nr:hypothetical protein [Streptosporangiaceae bacterium]
MDLTTSTYETATITCAYPGCGAVTTLADSLYIDGCGQVCPGCEEAHFPRPAWLGQIEPPF